MALLQSGVLNPAVPLPLPTSAGGEFALSKRTRKMLLWSLLSSLLIHSTLVPTVLIGMFTVMAPIPPGPSETALIETRIADGRTVDQAPPAALQIPLDIPAIAADPDAGENLPDSVLAHLLKERIDRQSRSADGKSSEAELREMAARLQTISNDRNVSAMAERIGAALGISGVSPAPPVAAEPSLEFDHKSAQIQDVTSSTDADGRTQYVAQMIDARGMRMDVALAEEDGRELIRLFQLMRDFPLLEKVYRSVVMGLMDRMLQEAPSAPPEQSPKQ